MQHRWRMQFLALMTIALFGLSACAPGGAATTGSSGTPVNSPIGTATGTPPVGATPTAGAPTSGPVTLVLNQSSYGQGDTIKVTIKNEMQSQIFSADHHSDCTLVDLQIQSGGTWKTVAPCRLEILTKIVPLAAGSSTPQMLAPAVTSQSANNSWPAGTYHIAFSYGLSSAEALTTQTLVYSATFAIS